MQIINVWSPQAGPQKALVDCVSPECFFGGARGGGKTDGVIGKWAIKEKRFGPGFRAGAFRRTSVSFEDTLERAKQIYLPLGAIFVAHPARFRMPNGGRIYFAHLDSDSDALGYQGWNLSDAWVEEAGHYISSSPIDKLFGILRSASGVPVQLILTANPGGPGQHWIRERYKLYPFPQGPKLYRRELPNGQIHSVAVIPSRIADNRILLNRDPGYIGRLHLVGSEQLVAAWLEGDGRPLRARFSQNGGMINMLLRRLRFPIIGRGFGAWIGAQRGLSRLGGGRLLVMTFDILTARSCLEARWCGTVSGMGPARPTSG